MVAAVLVASVTLDPFCRKIWLEALSVLTCEPSKILAFPLTCALLTEKLPKAEATPIAGVAAKADAADTATASATVVRLFKFIGISNRTAPAFLGTGAYSV